MDLSLSFRLSHSPEDGSIFFLATLYGCPCVMCWEVIHGSTEFNNAFYVTCFPGSLLDLVIVKQDFYYVSGQ